jgi:hypothetical protein
MADADEHRAETDEGERRKAPLSSAMSDRNTLPTTRPMPSSEARRSQTLRHFSAAARPAAAKASQAAE